jgi:hypothetical protein
MTYTVSYIDHLDLFGKIIGKWSLDSYRDPFDKWIAQKGVKVIRSQSGHIIEMQFESEKHYLQFLLKNY